MRRVHPEYAANIGKPKSTIRRAAACRGVAAVEFNGPQTIGKIIGVNTKRCRSSERKLVQGGAWNGYQSFVRGKPYLVLPVLEHLQDCFPKRHRNSGERNDSPVAPHRQAARRT